MKNCGVLVSTRPDGAARRKRDTRALSKIGLVVQPQCLVHLEAAETTIDAWKALQSAYEDKCVFFTTRWKKHVNKNRDELNMKFRKMYWLLERNSDLSKLKKIIIYKQILQPVWSYGIQLSRCASDSVIQVIQRFQSKVLKCIVQAPWYTRNSDLYRDLRIETVTDIITRLASSHKKRLQIT
jgi:hypothetical protein